MHALEKLWKAGYAFDTEGSLEADLWVLDRTLRILFGEVGQVVKGIRQSITKRALAGPKRKTLNAVADYLYRNRAHMRYDEYLANGWPIASGPVEGACKNLIKDRMERSGMRWTEQMAEAILQLRAIYLSEDFDQYWQFHIEQDQRRLYPALWSVVQSWPHPNDFSSVRQLYIYPIDCIDCGACVPVCPVSAIFLVDDLPEKWKHFTEINASYVQDGKFTPDEFAKHQAAK